MYQESLLPNLPRDIIVNQPSLNPGTRQSLKKKRLLLVDANPGKSALRIKIMGAAGLNVDCASDTVAARALWRANSYNLVLIDLRHDAESAAVFCAEIKTDSPRQVVAFLVGKPAYLSPSPHPELPAETDPSDGWTERVTTLLERECSAAPVRGGFQEAVWRMSANRSLNGPRQKKTSATSFGEAVRRIQSRHGVPS
jgi:CheY-like chemotaxis protein